MAEEATPQRAWLEYWREATVALGTTTKANIVLPDGNESERDIFGVIGTGVIFGLPEDQSKTPWLVTARHVFHDPTRGWDPESIRLRFAWFEDRPVEDYLGIAIPLKYKGKHLWTAHPMPSVDLAAIPLRIPKEAAEREGIAFVPLGNFATPDDIYEGASVTILGYPAAVGPAFWTRSVVRSGVIAWVNPTNPAGEQLLIDSMVFPGNSGGPVFRIPTGLDRYGNFVVGGRPAFLGIVTQGRKHRMPLIVEGKRIHMQGPRGPIDIVTEDWIGVGIVEPASRVAELLKAATRG